MALRNKRIRRLAAATLLIAGIAGSPLPAGEIAEIRERGKLVMLSFPHQESVFVRTNLALGPTPRTGTADHFQGIDVDLMKRFAESLGVALEIRLVSQPSYGALIPDLLHGRGNVIASSFSITAVRREKVDFTEPYLSVYLEFVARLDSRISTVEDLTGGTAAILKGSSHEEHLRQMGIPPQQILAVEFNHENYTAVLEGDADYTLADSISVMRFLSGQPQLKVAFRLPGRDDYGFAVRRDSDLRQHLNRFLAKLRGGGELERIIRRHMMPAGGVDRLEKGR